MPIPADAKLSPIKSSHTDQVINKEEKHIILCQLIMLLEKVSLTY